MRFPSLSFKHFKTVYSKLSFNRRATPLEFVRIPFIKHSAPTIPLYSDNPYQPSVYLGDILCRLVSPLGMITHHVIFHNFVNLDNLRITL